MTDRATQYIEQYNKMATQRSAFDGTLNEMAYYAKPSDQGSYTGLNYKFPHSSVAVDAVNTLASGIFSNSVPIGNRWFTLRDYDTDINALPLVKRYLSQVADIVLKKLQNSNFYLETNEMLSTYCAMGTGIMYPHISDDKKLTFSTYSIRDCCIAENPSHTVDSIYRKFKYTAKQAYQMWGDAISPRLKDIALKEQESDDQYEIIHIVRPRLNRDKKKTDSKNKKYESLYIEVEQKHIISESGFDEFPFQVPRFYKQPRSPYGLPPTFDALPELRILNRAKVDYIDAVEMTVKPPIFTSDMETVENGAIEAGTLNYLRQDSLFQQYQIGNGAYITESFLQGLKDEIRRAYFVDLFSSYGEDKYVTATATAKRDTEKFQMLSAFIQRLQIEFFAPLILRCISLLDKIGQLPPKPAELKDKELEIVYTNNLDSLINQTDVNGMMVALEQAMGIEQLVSQLPTLGSFIKIEEALKAVFKSNNIPTDIIRSEAEKRKYIQEKAKAQQEASLQESMIDKIGQVDPNKRPEDGSIASSLGLQ